MKHLAAYLLLTLGGNSSPSAKDVKGVLGSVGIEADDERLSTLISELKGKDIQEVCGYTHKIVGGQDTNVLDS
jgi:large subunit ribosomal protein LP2